MRDTYNPNKPFFGKVCDLQPHQIKMLYSTYDNLYVIPHKEHGKSFKFIFSEKKKVYIDIPEDAYFPTFSGKKNQYFFEF